MAELYYIGHGSFRITSISGKTVYVDPYAEGDYSKDADLILVTHGHGDHNKVELIKNKNKGCITYTYQEAITESGYRELELDWIRVVPVKAENANHNPKCCVGYILYLDGISIWASGDTSMYPEMAEYKKLALDWAVFPTDGIYNMGPEEAAECARLCGCKKAIPIHTIPGALYSSEVAKRFVFDGAVYVAPCEKVNL